MGEVTATTVQETVTTDLPCAKCGYNLRTLLLDAVCPECAQPVEASVRAAAMVCSELWHVERGAGVLAGMALWAVVECAWYFGSPPNADIAHDFTAIDQWADARGPVLWLLMMVPLSMALLAATVYWRDRGALGRQRCRWVLMAAGVLALMIVAVEIKLSELTWIRALLTPPICMLGVIELARGGRRGGGLRLSQKLSVLNAAIVAALMLLLTGSLAWCHVYYKWHNTEGSFFSGEMFTFQFRTAIWPASNWFGFAFVGVWAPACALLTVLMAQGYFFAREILPKQSSVIVRRLLATFFLAACVMPVVFLTFVILAIAGVSLPSPDAKAYGVGLEIVQLLFATAMFVCWGTLVVVLRQIRRGRPVLG